MREPERIKRILGLLEDIWTRYPDVRFNQLIDSLQWQYVNTVDSKYTRAYYDVRYHEKDNKKLTEVTEFKSPDLFYLEDDKFELFLVNYVNELKG